MKLIVGLEGKYLVSQDTTMEFESAILADENILQARPASYFRSRGYHRIWKYLAKFGLLRKIFLHICRIMFRTKEDYFVVLMGPKFQKCFPYFLRGGDKSCYMFDAWPVYTDKIIQFTRDFQISRLFVSSSQAAKNLNHHTSRTRFFWVPEGINPGEYFFLPVEQKDIDVLSIGRKYQEYHDLIREPLIRSQFIYRYAETLESKVFEGREQFLRGLARSKISICFPRNVTHPEFAVDYETLTIRYLQSMLSKCLIVGHAPGELIELFKYNPVIEVDMENASVQIKQILLSYSDYTDIIEKNYQEVLHNHTWKHRWAEIDRIIKSK